MSFQTDNITSHLAIVPYNEEVIWNPVKYVSSLSQEEYNNLRTISFVIEDGIIEIHYVDTKKETLFKKVEKYRIREELVNPRRLSFSHLWNKLSRKMRFESSFEYKAYFMFDIIYMESELFNIFSSIPAGFKIGYIGHLREMFSLLHFNIIENIKEGMVFSDDELEIELGDGINIIKDVDAFRSVLYI